MRQGQRQLTMLLVQSVLIQATAFLIRPTAAYQAVELDLPTAALGAVGSSFAIVPLLLAVPVGRWSDRFGARRMHLVGSSLVVLAAVVLLLAPTTSVTLVLANGVLGAGHLASIVGQQSTVANAYTSAKLDSAFGYYTFAASLGQALGPTLIVLFGGGGVSPNTGPIYLASFALALALFATTPTLPGPYRASTTTAASADELNASNADLETATPDESEQSVRDLLRVPGLTRAIATSALVLAAIDLSVIYLPALGAERGWNSAFVGALLTIRALFSMLSRLVLGRASRAVGRARLLTGSIAMSAATMLLVPVPMPAWLLIAVVAVLGLGMGVGQPLTMSWVMQQAPAGRRGQALRLAGNRTGQLIIPAVLVLLRRPQVRQQRSSRPPSRWVQRWRCCGTCDSTKSRWAMGSRSDPDRDGLAERPGSGWARGATRIGIRLRDASGKNGLPARAHSPSSTAAVCTLTLKPRA